MGTLFTTLNMCFVTSLLYAFNKDVRIIRDKIMPSDSGDGVDILHRAPTNNRTESLRENVTKDVESLEKEWDVSMTMLAAAVGGKEKEKVAQEVPYLQSRVEKAVKTRILNLYDDVEEFDQKKRVVNELDKIIEKMRNDCYAGRIEFVMRSSCAAVMKDEIKKSLRLQLLFFHKNERSLKAEEAKEQTERAEMEAAEKEIKESDRLAQKAERARKQVERNAFQAAFKTVTVVSNDVVTVELGPIKGKLGVFLVPPLTISKVHNWSELNKLNVDKCDLQGGKVVAADIGEGGEGDFVDVSSWSIEDFLRQKGQCGDRGVTLRIKLLMPVAVKKFIDKQQQERQWR